MKEIVIGKNDAGQRLDRFLKKYLANAPLSSIYRFLRKDIKLNGKRASENTMLSEGDVLAFYLPDSEIEAFTRVRRIHKAKRQFTVAYEDDDMLVVCKPFGLLTHGDKTEKKDTLANQVVDYLIETGDYVPRLERSFTPSPVHRLDRNTTGLVVFGKNAESLRRLSREIQGREIRKFYYALLCGNLQQELFLENRLIKDEEKNRVRILSKDAAEGLLIETAARPISSKNGYTFAEIELLTGRSHQIRAHMAHAGFPLLGDTKYGGKPTPLGTQLLHAGKLIIADNIIKAPIPESVWNCREARLFSKEIERI